jgi:hypothetical protein
LVREFPEARALSPPIATPARPAQRELQAASAKKVSSAVALLVGWFAAIGIAGFAYWAEGPPVMPTLESAFSGPAAPPSPPVQTYRTEDVYLPSPKATKPRKSR